MRGAITIAKVCGSNVLRRPRLAFSHQNEATVKTSAHVATTAAEVNQAPELLLVWLLMTVIMTQAY
ncbi:hypothetical protein FraEuI1c_0232 [Pseudofrankia inefficax]|uniref:Uncharacterized protein n=1 Tax=Pseudofrankia inefficax (strain DSM 45817 / CECT 9037 / DDB 130130 / EuI1c) TaxID=298654 RepID=E3J628_PSEI1|nr:hypothetical protein FraEuI1c_0232 [Pseudofrankia inefficax]